MAIEAQGLEIQIGARTLLHPTNFHVAKGDKIGLVGRNGAGTPTHCRRKHQTMVESTRKSKALRADCCAASR